MRLICVFEAVLATIWIRVLKKIKDDTTADYSL